MTRLSLPRFGDPAARRTKQASTWSLVVYLIFMFACAIAAGIVSARSFADGDHRTA